MWSARRAPWITPTLCPSGDGMKIGESGPSPKRSANVTLRAARVSAVCMTAFGSPVVLEVNMRWSRPSTRWGGGGVASAGFPARSWFPSRARPRPAPGPVVADDRHRRQARALPGGRDGELPGLGPAVPLDGEDRPGPAELGRVAKGALVGADRQVGGDRAPAERGEHRHHPLRPVRHEDEDDVARPDPLLRELGAEPAGFVPELFAAEASPRSSVTASAAGRARTKRSKRSASGTPGHQPRSR